MSLPIFTRDKIYTSWSLGWGLFKKYPAIGLIGLILIPSSVMAERWKVDFSRRTQDVQSQNMQAQRGPSSLPGSGVLNQVLSGFQPSQTIVILNTKEGFVPSTLHLQQGLNYEIHVVNVNSEKRNVSFIMDSFAQHHSTFYGEVRKFHIQPTEEGVYRFHSPETQALGRVVISPESSNERTPASSKGRNPER